MGTDLGTPRNCIYSYVASMLNYILWHAGSSVSVPPRNQPIMPCPNIFGLFHRNGEFFPAINHLNTRSSPAALVPTFSCSPEHKGNVRFTVAGPFSVPLIILSFSFVILPAVLFRDGHDDDEPAAACTSTRFVADCCAASLPASPIERFHCRVQEKNQLSPFHARHTN